MPPAARTLISAALAAAQRARQAAATAPKNSFVIATSILSGREGTPERGILHWSGDAGPPESAADLRSRRQARIAPGKPRAVGRAGTLQARTGEGAQNPMVSLISGFRYSSLRCARARVLHRRAHPRQLGATGAIMFLADKLFAEKVLASLTLTACLGSSAFGATITGNVKGPDGKPFMGACVGPENTQRK